MVRLFFRNTLKQLPVISSKELLITFSLLAPRLFSNAMSAENPTDSSPLYASYFYFTKTTPLQINHEPLKTDHLRALISVQLQFDTLKNKNQSHTRDTTENIGSGKGIEIQEVTITRFQHNKNIAELKQIQAEKNKKAGIYYNGKPPISLLSPFGGKPITFFYELLSKHGKKARAMEQNIEKAIQERQIDSMFNSITIQALVPIDDGDLMEFTQRYRPGFNEAKNWKTYDLNHYIKKCFKEFNSKEK